MSDAEYRDWKLFYRDEPWGLAVLDAMHAHIIEVLANINRNSEKRPEPYSMKDFLLFAEPAAEGEAEPVDVSAAIRAAFGG